MRKKRAAIAAMLLFIAGYMVVTGMGFYSTEFEKKPVVREKLKEADTAYLYDFYLSGTPSIQGRPFLGFPNASITVIIYADLSADYAKELFSGLVQQLRKDYVDAGKIRLYLKNHVSSADFGSKSDTFKYALALSCAAMLKPEALFDYAASLAGSGPEEILPSASVHSLPLGEFRQCLNSSPPKELLEDVSETENFGMVGISPRVYIGIEGRGNTIIDGMPSYARLKRVIRQFQVQIGD